MTLFAAILVQANDSSQFELRHVLGPVELSNRAKEGDTGIVNEWSR